MNLEQCEIKQLKQENEQLRAHVERLLSGLIWLNNAANIDDENRSKHNLAKIIRSLPEDSLQEVRKQAILDAVDRVQKKTSATVILDMIRDEANNLVKGGE